jgi:cardiolipin synthase
MYTIIVIVIPLVELLGILAAMHAIMNARTSQGAIAWAISLVTFPWLALILRSIFYMMKSAVTNCPKASCAICKSPGS